ncbi:hypothetical protein LO763_21815 [Glycomyces sp. A-F 0318]|uniref:hypothetical protein n=1 Tax=Glycomyces amatae TaxID=2881355 RepID=UPI001E3C89F9|nr:hypothetical protein [Glycomyces amatae]MCD0446253.1 hypothetical protein [Glycomyces amatae]
MSATRLERDNFLGARASLFTTMVIEMRQGRSVTAIARDAAGAVSHPLVLDHLRSVRLRDKAAALLRDLPGGDYFGVSYRDDGGDRFRSPKGVRMTFGFDPTTVEEGDAMASGMAEAAVAALAAAMIAVATVDDTFASPADALTCGEIVILTGGKGTV